MKNLVFLFLILTFSQGFAQETTEIEVKTEIKEVTVFINNAQITRTKTLDINPGIIILKFTNLSPFIDSKSIQVKAKGEVTVLSVNQQQNFIEKSTKSNEILALQSKLKDINDKITLENTLKSIVGEELIFLKDNRIIGGKNQEQSLINLKNTADYYSARLTTLNLKNIEHTNKLEELNKQKTDLENQINTLSGKKEFPTGEILVKVLSKKITQVYFEITYVTENAGWYPSYDIRAIDISEPVVLNYKANVHQDTKEDWNNVKLKLSTSNPNLSGVAPELKTYFLDYFTSAPVYNNNINFVSGRVLDSNMQPLPGVSIKIEGSNVGTITDANGNYSIAIPNNAQSLTFSYIGFQNKNLPINNSQMNVVLQEDVMELNEVIVAGYGSFNKKEKIGEALQGRMGGIGLTNTSKTKTASNLLVPIDQNENQTTINFDIRIPYTIKSDNKNYTIDMETYELPAIYKYYSVPKIDKDAFLIAYITDWEKYNLLDGEANIFFEGTYIGKTILDMRFVADTLNISLGRDKNVSVNRQKIKDFSTKQFIGSKKEESRNWITTVKNNKNQKIEIIVLDQVPVSTMEEIEVEVKKLSGAQLKNETGEIKWEFKLEPGDKKDLELLYSVKYPKQKNLIVE